MRVCFDSVFNTAVAAFGFKVFASNAAGLVLINANVSLHSERTRAAYDSWHWPKAATVMSN